MHEPAVNTKITAPRVRLIGADGQQLGVTDLASALRAAQDAGLDLVEVAPTADPPVAKILDYGRLRYEASLRDRAARRAQQHATVKEIKLRPRIDSHDLDVKIGHIRRFLAHGHRVKVTLTFRGREHTHPELGYRVLAQVQQDVVDLGAAESTPTQEGRAVSMLLIPSRAKDSSAGLTSRPIADP